MWLSLMVVNVLMLAVAAVRDRHKSLFMEHRLV